MEVAADSVWVAVTPQLRGRLHALDCCDNPQDVPGFAAAFQPGQKLRCHVLKVLFCLQEDVACIHCLEY